MKINRYFQLIVGLASLALLTVLALSACAPKAQVESLAGSDRDAVLAFTEPMTDNLLSGLNAGDYTVFSRDFDDQMLKAMPESTFGNLVASTTGKVGEYVSREVDRVEKIGEYYRVVYKAKFAQDDNAQMLVSFDNAEPNKIAGLFFTSDKMK